MPRKKLRKINELAALQGVHDIGYLGTLRDCRDILPAGAQRVVAEFGCGSGDFLVAYAQRHPASLCVGIDLQGERIYDAAKKSHRAGIPNTLFVRACVSQLYCIFPAGSLDEIWVTFPDPFPKKEADKRRLVHRRFLDLYHDALRPGGRLHFKTDSRALYEYALGEFAAFERLRVAEHGVLADHDPRDIGIPTKFERSYRIAGRTIYYVSAQRSGSPSAARSRRSSSSR